MALTSSAGPTPANSLDIPEVTHLYPTHGPKTIPRLLWRTKESSNWPNIPFVTAGIVVSGSLGVSLVGMEATTGRPRWRWNSKEREYEGAKGCYHGYPQLGSERLFYFSLRGELVALNPRTGHKEWEHLFPSKTTGGGGCFVHVAGSDVFVGTGWKGMRFGMHQFLGFRISAFDQRTGTIRWEREIRDGGAEIVVGEHVYVLNRRDAGSLLLSLDRATGRDRWQAPAGNVMARYESLESLRDGQIALCGNREEARLFDAATGKEIVSPTRQCGSLVNGLIVRYESWRARLTVKEASTGRIRWKREGVYHDGAKFSVADGVIYLGMTTSILALDLGTGSLLWDFRLPRELVKGNTWVTSPPVPADGALYFTTKDDHTWAIR